MSQQLIEQSKLSPPFTKDDVGYIYDSNMVVVAQTRGWGHFQYLPNAEKLQDEFAQFIVDAMNEKLANRPTCGQEQRKFLNEVEKQSVKIGVGLFGLPKETIEKVIKGE